MFGPYFPLYLQPVPLKYGTALGRALKMLHSRIPNQAESGTQIIECCCADQEECQPIISSQSWQKCCLRLLRSKVGPLFTKKGLLFQVEYVTNVQDWFGSFPRISTLHGAYRRRTIKDLDVVPHSFTFMCRQSTLSFESCEPSKVKCGKITTVG